MELAQSAKKIDLVDPDYAPASFVFHELSLLTFIELCDHARLYFDLMGRHEHDMEREFELADKKLTVENVETSEETNEENDDVLDPDDEPLDIEYRKPGRRMMDTALAAG